MSLPVTHESRTAPEGVIKVRFARRKELPMVSDIESRCFSQPWGEQRMREIMRQFGAGILVCFLDGRMAGYLVYRALPTQVSIINLGVDPVMRRRKCCDALLVRLEEVAEDSGLFCISCDVPEESLAAQLALRSRGYRWQKTIPDGGTSSYRMQRSFSPLSFDADEKGMPPAS